MNTLPPHAKYRADASQVLQCTWFPKAGGTQYTWVLGHCCTPQGNGHRLAHRGLLPMLCAPAEIGITPTPSQGHPPAWPCLPCTQHTEDLVPFSCCPFSIVFGFRDFLLCQNFSPRFPHLTKQTRLGWLAADIYACWKCKVVLQWVNSVTKQSRCKQNVSQTANLLKTHCPFRSNTFCASCWGWWQAKGMHMWSCSPAQSSHSSVGSWAPQGDVCLSRGYT